MDERYLRLACVIVCLVPSSTSCSPRAVKLPTGLGVFAVEGARAVEDLANRCEVDPFTADVEIRGSVDSQRVRMRLATAFFQASGRVESASQSDPASFVFIANSNESTIFFPRRNRALEHAPPDQVLEALLGLRLMPRELGQVLMGCFTPERAGDWRVLGDHWLRSSSEGGGKAYMYRDLLGGPWRIVSLFYPGEALKWRWRADYEDYRDGVPHMMHVESAERRKFEFRVRLLEVEIKVPLRSEVVFHIQVPPSAKPMTLDEVGRAIH